MLITSINTYRYMHCNEEIAMYAYRLHTYFISHASGAKVPTFAYASGKSTLECKVCKLG